MSIHKILPENKYPSNMIMDVDEGQMEACTYKHFSTMTVDQFIYSGTCLNRPAMGPATYGLFIQVVSLCKFEILDFLPSLRFWSFQ